MNRLVRIAFSAAAFGAVAQAANLAAAAPPCAAQGNTAQMAPAPSNNMARAVPSNRSHSYQQAPANASPAQPRTAGRTYRAYSYSPGYSGYRGSNSDYPVAPYQESPRYLHADAKARGWNFRYSPNRLD